MIPQDLKIFSLIYESRIFFLLPLYLIWFFGGFYFLFQLKKVYFLWILIFPLLLQPLNLAVTYCGWHYRMELRERFAKTDYGYSDSYSSRAVNIDLMPPEIRAEYARNNYHPRFRDMKAMIIGTIVLTPILYLSGGGLFGLIFLIRKRKRSSR